MSLPSYRVPIARAHAEHLDRGSRFLAVADRARSVEEARALIDERRREMPDASHHGYAFGVGYGASVTEGMSDDGEPSGTAGRPMLAVLRGSEIGDLAVVVTRYFGGTKLGTGGLVRAYTAATQAVIAAIETEWKVSRVTIVARIPYGVYERLKRELELHQAIILREDFGAEVEIEARIEERHVGALGTKLATWTAGGGEIHTKRATSELD